MDGTKRARDSKGVIGGVIGIIGSVVALIAMLMDSFFGVTIAQQGQDAVTGALQDAATGAAAGDWVAVAMAVVTLAGSALAIYGRLKAEKKIV